MYILEHFITAFEDDKDIKERYINQVWNILQNSYKELGGLFGFSDEKDLLKSNNIWKLVRRNENIITAVAIYKTRMGGRKLVAGGSDGTAQGKHDFYTICYEDVKMVDRKAWAEVSGALEGIYLFKYGGVPLPIEVAEPIINKMGQKVLKVSADKFHYNRIIGNEPMEKIMFGNVPEQYRQSEDWDSESKLYRDTFDNYNKEHPEELELRKNKH